jgi:hypothetical protein
MHSHRDVRSANLKDLFESKDIIKLNPIDMTPEMATKIMVAFDGQTIKAVWNTKEIGSYFILIDGESIVTIRIKGDK